MNAPDVLKHLSGVPVTLRYLEAWCDSPPTQADDAARRRMQRLRDEYRTALRRKQRDGYSAVLEQVNQTVDGVREFLTATDPDDIVKAVRAGRLSPDEAKGRIRQLMRGAQNARARITTVERDCEVATAAINQSPEDFDDERLSKYGARFLPHVSDHWLTTGDSELDPMKAMG